MLEQSSSECSSFVTLTYADENLPQEFVNPHTGEVYAKNSVNPDHHKAFIDRLRLKWRRKTNGKIRFYMCAEYGEKTARPHYHYALFGFPPCYNTSPRIAGRFRPCECNTCSFVSSCWPYGHIFIGNLEQASAQYVCGYVTKKLTNGSNERVQEVLKGRHPEFARMSNRDGIGAQAAIEYGKIISPYVEVEEDIPRSLIHNGRKWPLGRYLYAKVREQTGLPPLKEGEALSNYKTALRDLFQSKKPVALSSKMVEAGLPEKALELLNAQRSLSTEKQHERKKIKKGL